MGHPESAQDSSEGEALPQGLQLPCIPPPCVQVPVPHTQRLKLLSNDRCKGWADQPALHWLLQDARREGIHLPLCHAHDTVGSRQGICPPRNQGGVQGTGWEPPICPC